MKQHAYLLLFAALALGLWVQRVHIDEPRYPVQKYWASDLPRHAYPTATYLHNELRSGNFPLWNPYQMAGQPFVARR